VSHGFRVGGRFSYSVVALNPNSGIDDLPSTVIPVERYCWAKGSVVVLMVGLTASDPYPVGRPAMSVLSLMNVGTPANTPCGAVRAAVRARS
jgi:hypothetical protein